jgi:hypothetical protein
LVLLAALAAATASFLDPGAFLTLLGPRMRRTAA